MLLSRRTLPLALALAVICAAPAAARAQGAASGAARAQGEGAQRTALLSERQRLRVDLDRANAEVDALKRANRSLRDDYKLRARLADAEALARRLTDLDRRLGAGPSAGAAWTGAGAEPHGLPSDGPAELDAKADILSDQARKLAARGDALLGRAHELRARQTLRRRVGQMERDPFSPLEGSKRRSMASGTLASGGTTIGRAPTPESNGQKGASGGGTISQGGAPASDQAPPPAGAAGPTLSPPARDTTGAAPGATALPPSVGTPTGLAVTPPKTGPTPATPTGLSDGSGTLSAQLRDLLDPATLAELQRLEATAGPVSGVDALERAGAALKARAERLQREAAALRAARAR